jgi:GNAT superfamily N-acetyltransferase
VAGLLVKEVHPMHLPIDNVDVSPAAQDRGLGAALLAEAEREAARQKPALLRLSTHAKMAAIITRDRRAGFAEVARITEKGFDRLYMQKQLAVEHGA